MTTAKPPTRGEVQIAVGLAAALLFFVVILNALHSDINSFDFAGFYTGGLIIRQGNASRLYDLGEQWRIERQLFNRKKLLIVNHPPFEALIFAGLARMSYRKAYVVWGATNVFLWLFFQHLLRRHATVPENPYRYLLLCSLFFPLWTVLILGQITVILLLLFSLTFVCQERDQDFRAGVFLGLGLIKFPIVLPFALICFLRGKWRLMAGFAASASFLGVLSVIAVGSAGVRSYTNLLIDIIRHPDNAAYSTMRAWDEMPTVKGALATLLTNRLAMVHISELTAVISGSLILFVAWRWRQEDGGGGRNSSGLMFAAALAVSQVAAPHMYGYDLTLMLLAILLAVGSSQWSEKTGERVVLTAIIVILYCPPVYTMLLQWNSMYILAPVLVAFALAAISLARMAPAGVSARGLSAIDG
ncbi:MAG: glycosyltransferase family 87 protein [Candidatus Sulfotelmatobacter sp.]